jgi:hypothetical protein
MLLVLLLCLQPFPPSSSSSPAEPATAQYPPTPTAAPSSAFAPEVGNAWQLGTHLCCLQPGQCRCNMLVPSKSAAASFASP